MARSHYPIEISPRPPRIRVLDTLSRIIAVVTLLLLPGPGSVHAQDEHNRRFAVELVVLAGDLRFLQQDGLTDRHRRGLDDRIASALGFLGLTGRTALQMSGRRDPDLAGDIARLRSSFAAGDLAGSEQVLQELKQRYPLDTRGFLPVEATPARLARGREIYRSTCRACHIAPDLARLNPARDLFRDALTMPPDEYVARLLGGVRGVAATGLENPFPDEDLRALLAWFTQTRAISD